MSKLEKFNKRFGKRKEENKKRRERDSFFVTVVGVRFIEPQMLTNHDDRFTAD